MDVLKFGFQYWKRNMKLAVTAQIVSFVAIVADLILPLLMEMLIDFVIQDQSPSGTGFFSFLLNGDYGQIHTMELFWHLAFLYGGLLLFRIILVYSKNVGNQNLGLRLETDLRKATYQKLMSLDSETISEYNTGELLTTINSDTIMFKEMFCRMFPNMMDGIFALIISIVMLAKINLWLLILPVLLAPVFAHELMKFRKQAKQNYREIRAKNSEMSLDVQENIEAVRLVRAFTNEEIEKQKFNQVNEGLKAAHLKQIGLSAKFEVVFSIIRQAAYIGTIAVSAVLVFKGYLMVGYLVACSSYVMKIMTYVTQISNTLFQMQQQLVSGQKMLNFMTCESKVFDQKQNDQTKGNKENSKQKPNLQIIDASLVLDGKQVLKKVNLDVPYGKKIGIVGGTGSGKSLLLESLVRNHELTSGQILMNGKDIREFSLHELRDQFSYVFQEAFLFSNTVDSNIAYAMPEVEEQQVEEAAKCAQAHEFIMNLPQGYHTIVGERGLGISGGQKQRLSIARAILKGAPILVLDDSTSALDVDTERKLLKDIKNYCPDKTLLISAHRLTSVEECDEIIYMQDGMIVERGTFKELMKLGGHFASIYHIQEAQRNSTIDFDYIDTSAEGGL